MPPSVIYRCKLCSATQRVFTSTCRALGLLHAAVQHSAMRDLLSPDILETVESKQSSGARRIRVYQTIMEVLSTQLHSMAMRGSNLDLCKEGFALLWELDQEARSEEGIARLLSLGYKVRMRLPDFISHIQPDDPDKYRSALRQDDIHAMRTLKELISSDTGQKALLALSQDEDAAEWILNLIDKFHDDGTFWHIMCGIPEGVRPSPMDVIVGGEFKSKLERLDVKLTELSGFIPSSLIKRDVRLIKETSEKGGAFSDVYEGQAGDGTKIAIKKLRTSLNGIISDSRAKQTKAFCREASIWKNLKHPNVLPLLGVNFELFPRALCLVSLWAENDNIMTYVNSQGFIAEEVHRLLYEAARGLAYLHKENVVHGDLRSPNILIDGHCHVRLADFGLAGFADSTFSSPATRRATPKWSPPECIEYEDQKSRPLSTREADMFAFSGICWEIHAGKPPFEHYGFHQAINAISHGKRPERSDCRRTISERVWKVMTDCWSQDPVARPSARGAAAYLECYAVQSGKKRQKERVTKPTPGPYLSLPTGELPRRRSLEDLTSGSSESRSSDSVLPPSSDSVLPAFPPGATFPQPAVNYTSTSETRNPTEPRADPDPRGKRPIRPREKSQVRFIDRPSRDGPPSERKRYESSAASSTDTDQATIIRPRSSMRSSSATPKASPAVRSDSPVIPDKTPPRPSTPRVRRSKPAEPSCDSSDSPSHRRRPSAATSSMPPFGHHTSYEDAPRPAHQRPTTPDNLLPTYDRSLYSVAGPKRPLPPPNEMLEGDNTINPLEPCPFPMGFNPPFPRPPTYGVPPGTFFVPSPWPYRYPRPYP